MKANANAKAETTEARLPLGKNSGCNIPVGETSADRGSAAVIADDDDIDTDNISCRNDSSNYAEGTKVFQAGTAAAARQAIMATVETSRRAAEA